MTRPTDDELRELLDGAGFALPRLAPTLAREVLELRAELARLREGVKDVIARAKSPTGDVNTAIERGVVVTTLRALITEGEG